MIARRALPPLLVAMPAWAQQHAMDVPRGDPDRRLLLDAIRPTLARLTEGEVHFGVTELRRFGEYAFGVLQPRRPERQPIDWAGTRFRDQVQDKNFREGRTFVLWRRLAEGWKVEEYAIGAPDTIRATWGSRFGLPRPMLEPAELP